MTTVIDVETIYREARDQEEAPRKSIRDHIADSVPYWIILVAEVLYGLSAPHTAAVFDKLTPGWDLLPPLVLNLGYCMPLFGGGWVGIRWRKRPGRCGCLSWTLHVKGQNTRGH